MNMLWINDFIRGIQKYPIRSIKAKLFNFAIQKNFYDEK